MDVVKGGIPEEMMLAIDDYGKTMRTGSADDRFEWVGLATVNPWEKTPKGKGRKEG